MTTIPIPLWAQFVLALLGSSFFGALASVIVSPIVARQQIRQLEITYHQKLNDNFIQNTRQYIDTLYIPISRSLSKLDDSYKIYKRRKSALRSMRNGTVTISPPRPPEETSAKIQSLIPPYRGTTEEALHELTQACGNFRKLMDEITEQGRDVYLPMEFDERLRSLTHLLKAAGEDRILVASTGIDIEGNLQIDGKEFEKRYLEDMRYLKSFIKDVTLGTPRYK
jgi:hypothetical protein